MSQLYKRVATINIGGREFKCPPFDIEFEQKVVIGALTMTECRLYNPNNDTIKAAEGKKTGNYTDGPQVTIDAGYEDDHGTCVLGKSATYEVKRSKADTILSMKIYDETSRWANAVIATTYKNQSASSIIKAIASKVGIKTDAVSVGTDKTYTTFTAMYFRDALQKLCNDTGSELFFQNGVLTVQSKTAKGTARAVLLNTGTGLIGVPEKSQNGIKFQTLFLYKLMGGSIVKIESKNYNSAFKIITGKKTFSTFGKSECEFEAVPV
jgi:hypothetical protein